MTKEQAIALAETEFWKDMTYEQIEEIMDLVPQSKRVVLAL